MGSKWMVGHFKCLQYHLKGTNSYNFICNYIQPLIKHENTLYLLDSYTESTIINQQLETSNWRRHMRLNVFLDVPFKTWLQTLIQTSIYSSILKIIASNFQKILLSGILCRRIISLILVYIIIGYLLSYPGPYLFIYLFIYLLKLCLIRVCTVCIKNILLKFK